MPSMKKSSLIPIILVLGAVWAYGQKPPSAKPNVPSKQDSTKPKERIADFDLEDQKFNNKTGIATGRNFTYREEQTVVTGQKVRHDTNIKHLFAEGDLVLDDPEHHVVGDEATVDYSTKGKTQGLIVITGVVIITLKPKQDPMPQPNGAITTAPVTPPNGAKKEKAEDVSSARGRGVVITCDRVESLYRKKYVKIFGKEVRFTQKLTKKDGKEVERVVIAEHAEYDGKKDRLILFAPVKATDSDGQVINFSDTVIVGTKEGDEWLESKGKSKGIIKIQEEEEENPEATKNPPR